MIEGADAMLVRQISVDSATTTRVDLIQALENYIRQYAQSVNRNVKSLSNQKKEDLCFADSVSQSNDLRGIENDVL